MIDLELPAGMEYAKKIDNGRLVINGNEVWYDYNENGQTYSKKITLEKLIQAIK